MSDPTRSSPRHPTSERRPSFGRSSRGSLPLTISASPVDRVEEFFDEAEFESRRQRVRAVLRERDLNAILVSSPENVYYLEGLNHYECFVETILILTHVAQQLLSDRAAGAAIAAAGSGVNERHIAAEVYRTMIDAGGDLTGFPVLIRSDRTLRFEHIVWRDHELDKGERLFVELAGCVRRYHAPQG